ncbi:hypothetical protein EJD97_018411 [Solanum chilense]|uniref:Uncharacterized protein n=2 Tax=Solanum subgen. Lycopersicon TaxID=49274 RepID=K4CFI3_SOLLC|nr:hypothetical protein EJD97_018411 [Solanum chilense]
MSSPCNCSVSRSLSRSCSSSNAHSISRSCNYKLQNGPHSKGDNQQHRNYLIAAVAGCSVILLQEFPF